MAIKLPKLTIISKFKSVNSPTFNILLKIYTWPLDDIGNGSVKPCIIPNIMCFIISINLITY